MKTLKAALIACGLVTGLSALIHPAGQHRSMNASQSLLRGSGASPAILAFVETSCQNCHSEKTKWPWYSYVAPMSWMIENDVGIARQHMNLSKWEGYRVEEKIEILAQIAPLVHSRIMPPKRYVVLHPEAKLSQEQIDQLANWAREERDRLREILAK